MERLSQTDDWDAFVLTEPSFNSADFMSETLFVPPLLIDAGARCRACLTHVIPSSTHTRSLTLSSTSRWPAA
jgi:hypothetical protein